MSDQTDDEVGYGKPPKATRFKKGQSGNPRGRPAGAKGVKASLKRELDSTITVREGGRDRRVTKAEALAKTMIASSLKGNTKSQSELLKLDDELYGAGSARSDESSAPLSPQDIDLEMLRDFFVTPSATEKEDEDDND
jgi:hypothetical protein